MAPNRDPATGRFTSGGGGGSSGGFNLGNAYGAVTIDVSGVGAAMKQAQSDIQNGLSGIGQKVGSAVSDIGAKIESIGKSITGIGTKMTAIGAPVAAGFAAAAKQAVNFDESITNIAAVLNLSQDEAKKLGDELKNVGSNSRAGAQQVAQAYYDIAGGVADASTHMAILQAAIKTSEAGNSDLAGTTSALISVMNSYNLTAEQASMVSDVLTRTVGMGVGTMDQFAAAFPSVTGVANSLGISFENLGQMMAYLTTKGNTASEAAVQLSSLMVAMLKPNTDMADALKELGFQSGEAAVQQLGLVGAYQAINKTQVAASKGMGQLIGRVEGIRAVTSFGSKDVDTFFKKFTDGVKSATDAAQKIQNQSMAAKWDILNSRIQDVAITIGQTLFPILSDLMEKITPVVYSIMEWVKQNPQLVQQIALLVGGLVVLGPIIAGIGMVISTVGAIISGLGVVIGVVLGPVGLLIAAGAAIVYLFKDQIGGAISVFIDYMKRGEGVFTSLAAGIMALFGDTAITRGIEQFLLQVQDFFDHFQDRVKLFASLFQLYFEYYIGNPLSELWVKVQPALSSLLGWFVSDGLPWIQNALLFIWNNVLQPVFGFIGNVWEFVKKGLGDLWSWFTAPGGGWDTIGKALSDANRLFIQPLIDNLKRIWTASQPALDLFKGYIKDVFQWVTDNVINPIIKRIEDFLKLVDKLRGQNPDASMTAGLPANMIQPTVPKVTPGDPLAGISGMFYGLNKNDILTAINAQRAGTGVAPIPAVGGGSAAKRDVGGVGLSGMAYQIGRSQLQNEIYIPGADGQFVSGFVDLMKQVAANVSGSNGGQQFGDINVMMPAAALANPEGAYAAGQDFGRGVRDEMRSQGVKGVR